MSDMLCKIFNHRYGSLILEHGIEDVLGKFIFIHKYYKCKRCGYKKHKSYNVFNR